MYIRLAYVGLCLWKNIATTQLLISDALLFFHFVVLSIRAVNNFIVIASPERA